MRSKSVRPRTEDSRNDCNRRSRAHALQQHPASNRTEGASRAGDLKKEKHISATRMAEEAERQRLEAMVMRALREMYPTNTALRAYWTACMEKLHPPGPDLTAPLDTVAQCAILDRLRPRDAVNMCRLNKRWYALRKQEQYWKGRCQREFSAYTTQGTAGRVLAIDFRAALATEDDVEQHDVMEHLYDNGLLRSAIFPSDLKRLDFWASTDCRL